MIMAEVLAQSNVGNFSMASKCEGPGERGSKSRREQKKAQKAARKANRKRRK